MTVSFEIVCKTIAMDGFVPWFVLPVLAWAWIARRWCRDHAAANAKNKAATF
jgi:hypothetical protein